ncbi:MAG: glycosyltransferase family 2 protein [Acidobacteriota bacterium]
MQQSVSVAEQEPEVCRGSVPDFSVVIVCRNNKVYLEPCLESLYRGNVRTRFDVVVVDNGSSDGTPTMVRDSFPRVQLIQNDHNAGLSAATNQGISATRGRYVLLLNDDTIVNATSLDSLVQYLEDHPEVAGVGGKLLNADGTVQSCYNRFSTLREEFLVATRLGELFREGYPATTKDNERRVVDWIGSACLMLRRSALDEVGLLDEEYFIYGDEADLQYRLNQAGWQICYIPHASTVHYGGRSMNRWSRRKMVYRGKLLFYRKNYGAVRTTTLRLMFGALSVLKMLFWSFALAVRPWRRRAVKELRSNRDVVEVCRCLS